MIKTLFTILASLLLLTSLLAQNAVDTTQQKRTKNAVFIEFFGASGYSSINYDRAIKTINKFNFRAGLGVGYANYKGYTPNVVSYITRVDVSYGKQRIKPTIGYAFSYNDDLETYTYQKMNTSFPFYTTETVNNYYLAHTPNVGLAINIKRVTITPKYYLILIDRSDYDNLVTVHWGGLQIKFNF